MYKRHKNHKSSAELSREKCDRYSKYCLYPAEHVVLGENRDVPEETEAWKAFNSS
jgi:hypothetical protein